jgi:hypothetical protein
VESGCLEIGEGVFLRDGAKKFEDDKKVSVVKSGESGCLEIG